MIPNSQVATIVEPCGHRSVDYKTHVMSIGPGPMGTWETLQIMAKLAREAPEYYEFCEFVRDYLVHAHHVRTPDDIDRSLRAIYAYTPEEVETLYAPPYNVSQLKQTGKLLGDCDDITMMYCACFHMFGWRSRMVAMRTRQNDPEFYHVVPEVQQAVTWKRYDPTLSQPTLHKHFGTMIVYV